MKTMLLVALFALPTVACGLIADEGSGEVHNTGTGDHVASAIPLGLYTQCTGEAALNEEVGGYHVHEATGGDGTLTLESTDAGTLKATLAGDKLRASGAIAFTSTTATTAVATSAQSLSIVGTTCGYACGADAPPSDEIVDVPIDVGALTFVDRTLFLSIEGGPHGDSYFFACTAPTTAPTPPTPEPSTTPAIATGVFGHCSGSAGPGYTGSFGSVRLDARGAIVTATFDGVPQAQGALDFTTTSDGTARLVDGQTPSVFAMGCTVACVGCTPTGGFTPLKRSAGALVVQGDAVFIDLTGATDCKDTYPTLVTCTR
jgi:hypothetical protein